MGIRKSYGKNKKTGRHEVLAALMIERSARNVAAGRHKVRRGARRPGGR